jgi:hypothetical protein
VKGHLSQAKGCGCLWIGVACKEPGASFELEGSLVSISGCYHLTVTAHSRL